MSSFDLKREARSAQVKQIAHSNGFADCRIAEAGMLENEARYLEAWLNKNHHGQMAYLEGHFDKRIDPRVLEPGARSVIVFTLNYYPNEKQKQGAPKISKYAYGRDYHKVIRKKLKQTLTQMQEQFGPVNGRGFVDSAPVMEKAWAQRAGIGWMGKHTNVITKQLGSFYFLAVLIVDVDLAPDNPVKDHCGSCTACIDACPTNAIEEAYTLNASKCISYYTIELKENELPNNYKGKFDDWMFGCDICQDVCPWNRFSIGHSNDEFRPKTEILEYEARDWEDLSKEKFDEIFSGSAVKRAGYDGLMRNIHFLTNQNQKP